MKAESMRKRTKAIQTSNDHTIEVTGLGTIAALLVGFGGLVTDGTLPLNQYLVFAAFLLVSAGGLAWRIFKSAPSPASNSREPERSGN
jgi:hypothetical protein